MTVVFLFFINSQSKTNAQSVLHLNQSTRGHERSRTLTRIQTYGAAANSLTDKKTVLFSTASKYTSGFKFPHT